MREQLREQALTGACFAVATVLPAWGDEVHPRSLFTAKAILSGPHDRRG